jgi:hypothetical protein
MMEARSAGTVKLGPASPPRSASALAMNARSVPRVQTPGLWRLLLAAANSAGAHSASASLSFTIVK